LHPIVRSAREPYRYEREVEEFLRWSPHVRGSLASQRAVESATEAVSARTPVQRYDELEAHEVIVLLASLEGPDLTALLEYERANRAREDIIRALEAVLARR
ncbi:MAG TPA: hypothetical protein VI111_00640, partial [Thermoleophilaceae bacterium]